MAAELRQRGWSAADAAHLIGLFATADEPLLELGDWLFDESLSGRFDYHETDIIEYVLSNARRGADAKISAERMYTLFGDGTVIDPLGGNIVAGDAPASGRRSSAEAPSQRLSIGAQPARTRLVAGGDRGAVRSLSGGQPTRSLSSTVGC